MIFRPSIEARAQNDTGENSMAKFELDDFILLQHQLHHKQLQQEQQQLQRELEGEDVLGFRVVGFTLNPAS